MRISASEPLSGLRIDFGRAQAGVVLSVSRLLDEDPIAITEQAECGAGPITAVRWESGLTLNFFEGAFRGWVSSDPELPADGGFRPGMMRVELPAVSFQLTSLGDEFSRGQIGGLLDESATVVELLWSGTTCFFR